MVSSCLPKKFRQVVSAHSYLRLPMALDGAMPADKAGIESQGDNKWITLTQNASRR